MSPMLGGQWLPARETRQESEARMTDSKEIVVREREAELMRPEASFMDLMMLGETLVKTGFLPIEIKNAGQAVAIILTGRELGLGPMQSLRSVGIIKGKPFLAADLQLGLFHRAGGKSHFSKLTEQEAELELSAPWLVKPHVERFTMEDAKRANLTGKDVWRQYPKALLRSRVITAGLKSAGYLPCAGLYDPEELGGSPTIGGETAEPATATPPNGGNGQIKAMPEVAPDVPSVDDTVGIRMRLTLLLKSPCFRTDRWLGELRKALKLGEEQTVNGWLKAPERTMKELLEAEEAATRIHEQVQAEKEAGQTKAPLSVA